MALPYPATPAHGTEVTGEASVRAYIDNTLCALFHELSLPASVGRPSVTLRRRTNATAYRINSVTGALEAVGPEASNRTYYWPGNSAFEAWRFSMSDPSASYLLYLYFSDAVARCDHRLKLNTSNSSDNSNSYCDR
ncbi:hypothetical protein N7478_005595 [Penicillium angulare]|uniref:uncharacterized protein n=1 Tax=Penicillium angulare TaxID=116970 RepID=UPI00254236B9|nr:uncharacterized protein N7478_005595 [Penicillium angulare]KAJ5280223.1 hypothetical protein N7478_005595 [Penicillium angulare]